MKSGIIKTTFIAVCLTFGLAGCHKDDPLGNENYLVRIDNTGSEAVTVKIGPVNYESVPAGTTTEYEAVFEGNNKVYINGERVEDAEFGSGLTGEAHWTYYIDDSGHGFSLDGI